jgi:hypothetical protein
MVLSGNSQFVSRRTDWSDLFFTDAGNNAAPGSLCVPDGDGCKMRRVLAFRKYHFGHTAPHVPAKVHTGNVPDPVKAQPFNGFSCGFDTQIAFFILVEKGL